VCCFKSDKLYFVNIFSANKAAVLGSVDRLHKKGKAIPLQAWAGPAGSRRLRLLDFKTIGT